MAGKVWVLETSTKGTGANMVPLERVLRSPSSTSTPLYVPPRPRVAEPEPPPPRPVPRRFRVVDLLSRQILGDDMSAPETAEVLGGVRSVVDINVYVWEPAHARWRLLTSAEQGTLWDLSKLRGHGAAEPR